MMAKDTATESIALLGILSGSVTLDGTAGEAYAVSQNAAVKLPMDGRGRPDAHAIVAAGSFHGAVDMFAEALAGMSLKDPDAYAAILHDVSEAGSSGWLVCTPVNGYWPDAMLPVDPVNAARSPADRCFPLYHWAVARTMELPEGSDMEEACMENPDRLAYMPAGEEAAFFAGWCSAAGMVTRMPAVLQDFRKPWTVVANADGSDYVAPAQPMVLVDRAVNAWAAPAD